MPSTEFLERVAYHSREPMVELDAQGTIQNANRAARQLFKLGRNAPSTFANLKLFGREDNLLVWHQLLRDLSYLPSIVRYTPEVGSKTHLFSLSVEKEDLKESVCYFLVLNPIVTNSAEVETYRLAEEKFYKAFHLSPDAISITRLSDGLFMDVNEGFVQLTGYPREDLIGKTSLDIELWSVPEERNKMIEELRQHGQSFMEAKYQIKDGELADGQINARIITIDDEDCLISVVRDLREQKRIEQALRSREQQLEVVNRATNDAIWDWDLSSDTLAWNDSLQRIFGYSASEIEPTIQWWEQHIHPEDRERVSNRIRYFIENKQETWFDKYRFARTDGSYAYVYDKGHIIRDDDHKPVRMVGGMVDITDRVLAEESLLIRNQQIAEYAFFNSHRLRGPLSRMLGLTSLLKDDMVQENEPKELIMNIHIVAEEIDEMISEITKIFY